MDLKWLETCATAGELLYGYYSVTALKKMYEKKPGCAISQEEVISGMKELSESGLVLMDYISGRLNDRDDDYGFYAPRALEGTPMEKVMREAGRTGNPYASLHLDERERLELVTDCPEDVDYYIPAFQETEQLVQEGYIRTPEMTKLEEEIRRRKGDPAPLTVIWAEVSTDKLDTMESIHKIVELLSPASEDGQKEKKGFVGSLEELNHFVSFANAFLNSVNLRARKGWRPHELFEKTRPREGSFISTVKPGSVRAAELLKQSEDKLKAMGVKADYSSIDRMTVTGKYGERRVVKVGRNDPCPCGSGLKYKRCHGRGR